MNVSLLCTDLKIVCLSYNISEELFVNRFPKFFLLFHMAKRSQTIWYPYGALRINKAENKDSRSKGANKQ